MPPLSRKNPRSKRIFTEFTSQTISHGLLATTGQSCTPPIVEKPGRSKQARRGELYLLYVSSAALNGWISGSYGTVLQTRDGGMSWHAQPLNIAEHLFASHWLDESHGWLAGSRGMTIQTSDGGRSWTNLVVPGDFTFNAVTFANASRGWLAGEFGVIFQTSDGGKSWVKQKSPVEVSFDSGASQNLFALLFTAPTNGYAFGLDGLVLKPRTDRAGRSFGSAKTPMAQMRPTISSPPRNSTAAFRRSAKEARCYNPMSTTILAPSRTADSTP